MFVFFNSAKIKFLHYDSVVVAMEPMPADFRHKQDNVLTLIIHLKNDKSVCFSACQRRELVVNKLDLLDPLVIPNANHFILLIS